MESFDSDVEIIDGCTLASNNYRVERTEDVADRIQGWMAKNDAVNKRAKGYVDKGEVNTQNGSNGDGQAGIEIKKEVVTIPTDNDKTRRHFSRKCTNPRAKREIPRIVRPITKLPPPLSRNGKRKATTSAVENGGKHLDIGPKMEYRHPSKTRESHGPLKTEKKTKGERSDRLAVPVVSEHVQRFWVKKESTYWKSPDTRKAILVSDVGTNTECFERSIPSQLAPAPATSTTMAAGPAEVKEEAVSGAASNVAGANAEQNEDETPDGDSDKGPDDEEYYEVEKIVRKIHRQNKVYYLVRWKGYDKDADTWETLKHMRCNDLIDDFEKMKKGEANAKKRGWNRRRKRVAAKRAKAKATADMDIEDSLDSWFQHCDELIGQMEQLQPPKGRGQGGGPKVGCKKKKRDHGA